MESIKIGFDPKKIIYCNWIVVESYVKNTVLGERSDIEKITAKHLNQIYKDFYATNNTFIVVCGDFDENEVLEDIKEYMKKIKTKKTPVPKRIKRKITFLHTLFA